MMTRKLLARCAPLAIAASVALPFLPATAQDATVAPPVIALPDTAAGTAPPAPTAAPAPTIVLPEPAVDPAPAVAVEAEPAPPPQVIASQRPAALTAGPRAAAAAPGAAGHVLERSAPMPVAETQAPAIAADRAPAVAPAPEDSAATSARDSATNEVVLAALLGVLGLGVVGGVAYAASRRRRSALDGEAIAYEPVAQSHTAESAIAHEPVVARTAEPMPAAASTAPAVASPAARAAMRSSGDPVALPLEVPETFEERDALLKELVAAEPDKANPFTGVRARARRAKLIMQSLGQDFRDRKPRIDLSEYTNRWPALRGWQPATA